MGKHEDLVIDDQPKYRKKSKGPHAKKSNHKHIYTDCIFGAYGHHYERNLGFVKDNHLTYVKGSYCTICGKVGDVHYENYMIGVAEDVEKLAVTNPGVPVYILDDFFEHNKYINGKS